MLAILATTFPFFALILCGYIAVRRHMLPQLAIPGMNGFVLYFALPCLLYRFGATTPIAQLLDPGIFAVYLLCGLLSVACAVAMARWRRLDWNNAAFGALVAAFPNTGFMGVPLLATLVGAHAAGPITVTLVVDLVIVTSLCVALSRIGHGAGGQGSGAALRQALAGMLRNPMPWAIALGALASAMQLTLPAPLMRTVGLLADAASPVALFTIGAVLARAQMQTATPVLGGGVVPVALLKLVLHPLLMAAIGHAAIAAGLPLPASALQVLILVACLPSASNVVMLAERSGADAGRVARIVLISTVLSFVTFSGGVMFLGR